MTLSETAAEVMALAQAEDVDAAVALAQRALEQAESAPACDRAGLWYAIAVIEHVRGDAERQVAAATP